MSPNSEDYVMDVFRLVIRVRKGSPKMCDTPLKPNLNLMLTNVGNSFKTMKAIVFKPNFDAVSPV